MFLSRFPGKLLPCFMFISLVSCSGEPRGSAPQTMPEAEALRGLSHRQVLEKIFAPSADCSQDSQRVPAQLRRLSRSEFHLTVEGIFGGSFDILKDLPPDESVYGFSNNATLNMVSIDHAVSYARVADKISKTLLERGLRTELGCEEDLSRAAVCAERLIEKYGLHAWRRPLHSDEKEALLKVFTVGAEDGLDKGIQLTLRALLTAPAFLYRTEIGKQGELTAYEWASALAYFFWSAGPDKVLLKKAADGSILQEEVLQAELARLIGSPRAKEGLKSFVDNWTAYSQVLQVGKDQARFPSFTSETRRLLANETADLFDHLVRGENAGFSELLLADYSFGPQELAAYYQVPWDASTGRLDFSAQERRGILGQASILSSLSYAHETHPIKRGKFVRERILCEELLPPPPTLNIQPPPPKEGATTRERFAAHSSQPVCKGCHVRIDGIGFGLEDFDPIGHFRTHDNGKVVDRSGELFDVDKQTRRFEGGKQLIELLAGSERAERCFALHWFRQAYGRVETEADICTIRTLGDEFKSGLSVRDLMSRVITQPSYRQRSL